MTNKKDLPKDTLPSAGCPGQIEIPTPKERESLDALRSIKERSRVIKRRLNQLKTSGGEEVSKEVLELEDTLASLQTQWKQLEKRWEKDVRERMIYLGHDEE